MHRQEWAFLFGSRAAVGRLSRQSSPSVRTDTRSVFGRTNPNPLSKKIPVLNSPWGRDYERPSDFERWRQQGHADLIDGKIVFTESFFSSVQQQSREFDPTGFDDGTLRRWVNRSAYRRDGKGVDEPAQVAINGSLIDKEIVTSWSGHPCKQLRPIKQVGTGSFVTKNPDKLTRRHRRFRTITPENN